jgi:hypothetical protein
MQKYWRQVFARAWREAAKSVGLETRERVVVALIIQGIIAIGLWYAIGPAMAGGTAWTRVLTAAAPFLLFPILFLWRLPRVPAEIGREQQIALDEANAKLVEKADRREIQETLGRFIAEADYLKARFAGNEDLVEVVVQAQLKWMKDVVAFFDAKLAPAYKVRLLSDTGIIAGEISIPEERLRHWRWMNYRAIRLHELLSEVQRQL